MDSESQMFVALQLQYYDHASCSGLTYVPILPLTLGYLRKLFFRVNDHFMRNGLNVKYARNPKNASIFRPMGRSLRELKSLRFEG